MHKDINKMLTPSFGYPRIPREEWEQYVGKVVMYSTNIDVSPRENHVYYTGVLSSIDNDKAKFEYSTWIEPALDYKEFGRRIRTLKLGDVFEIIPSGLSPESQKERFEFAQERK